MCDISDLKCSANPTALRCANPENQKKKVMSCVWSGGGAGGPAAAERGPSQRPRAVGEGEQDRRGAARGHGLIGPPHPGSAILSPLFETSAESHNAWNNADPGTAHVGSDQRGLLILHLPAPGRLRGWNETRCQCRKSSDRPKNQHVSSS